MAGKDNQRGGAVCPGMIHKAAGLSAHTVTAADLSAINKYALSPLTAEEVYTFKAVLCDNEIDRSYERFTLKALQDLKKLFPGKPVIKDHVRASDNQVARIYATELVQTDKVTKTGELYTQLVAYCYMVRTAGNADLIAEISGGIKKEGSVGCAIGSSICSICGTDNVKSYCRHWPGKSYDKDGGKAVCTFTLTDGKDAYEFSLVPVPAQKAAGTCKSYTGEDVYDDQDADEAKTPESINPDAEKAKALTMRARLAAIRARNNTN